jgi:transglutaminase-like putative cysteine protease
VSARGERPEGSLGFRVAVLVALVASGAAVLEQGVGSAATRAVVLLGYPVAFAIAYATRNHRPFVLRFAVTAVGCAVLVMFFVTVSHQAVSGFASLQVPMAEAFLWLLLVHAVDSPGRRSLLISLLSSTVLIALAGVLSLSMNLAPFLLVWAIGAVAALVLAQRSLVGRLPRLARAPRSRSRVLLGAAGAVVAIVLVVSVIGSGIFMLAPVAGTDRSLTFPAQLPRSDSVPVAGGLSNPTLGAADPARAAAPDAAGGTRASFGYFGFSDRLDTATRGRPDDTLVMRVRAASPDFWRAQTFDTWNGRAWSVSRQVPVARRGNQPIRIPPAPDDGPPLTTVPTDELVQTYYVEKPGPNMIFAAATPTKLYFEDRGVFQLPDGSLRAGVQLGADSVYTVVSERRMATAQALRASPAGAAPPELQDLYARPPVTTDRVRALAQTVTAGAPSVYDKVLALEAWMAAHTKYTLDIPPLPKGRDAVDQFLFVDRRGFCEQIGTSLVVMLRSLGIPARLAVGYASGERNPFTGLYEVRAKDAHAWAEVYFPGVGWQGFDPTASVPLAGDSAIDGAGAGALAYLDAHLTIPGWAPPLVMALAAIAVLVTLGTWVARRARRPRRPRPSWAATRLARLDRLGARRDRARAPGETLPEYAAALARVDPFAASSLESVARGIDAAMFSGIEASETERRAIDDTLDALDERWSRRGARDDALVPV